jgi:hypothetical protein
MEPRRTILDFEDLLYGNRHFPPVLLGVNAPGAQVGLFRLNVHIVQSPAVFQFDFARVSGLIRAAADSRSMCA